MAYQTIYKDIGIEDEATFGASTAGTASRLHVISASLTRNPNKAAIEETGTSNKGRSRMLRQNNSFEGDLSMFASPRNLHHGLELVNGTRGVTAALGTSAVNITYNQNTTGTLASKTMTLDRNNTQEKFSAVIASSLELSASDNLMEMSSNILARTQGTGVSIADIVGETVKPFNFSDINVSIHPGATYGSSAFNVKVSEWTMTYDNGLETIYQSNDGVNDGRDPSRYFFKIPSLTGSFQILHEGVTFTDAVFGCSEFYLRFDCTLTSCDGLINGVTPYFFRLDIPRVEFTLSTRNYEQAALSIEDVEFTAMFDDTDSGTSALWVPQLSVPFDYV